MRARARGFTLIEVLVALLILAISLSAIIGNIGRNVRIDSQLRDDTFADWVGMNELTTLRLAQAWPPNNDFNGDADMGGQKWHWEATTQPTADPGLLRIDIAVSLSTTPKDVVTTVTGFMGKPPGQQGGQLQQGGQP